MRRDRPQHVDEQLHSRQGFLRGSVDSSSCCFLGQFVVWFCLRPVRSTVCFGAGSSNNSGCAWYAEVQQYLCAGSSSGILWVETMASLPAAGGGAIPSRIGRLERRSLAAAPALEPHLQSR